MHDTVAKSQSEQTAAPTPRSAVPTMAASSVNSTRMYPDDPVKGPKSTLTMSMKAA